MLKPGHGIDTINEINDISEDVEEVVKVPTETEFVHPPTSPQQVGSLSKSPYMNIGVPVQYNAPIFLLETHSD